jgi:hypothetical protein
LKEFLVSGFGLHNDISSLSGTLKGVKGLKQLHFDYFYYYKIILGEAKSSKKV